MSLKAKDYVNITLGITAIIFGVWKLIGIYKADKKKDKNSVYDDKMDVKYDSNY